jgi:F0F1-type ATP synthase assembly protein I
MDVSQGRELSNGMHRSTGSFELVLSPLLLGLVGLVLDRWLGTTPLLIVILAIVGLIGACVNLYYGYKHQMDEHEANAPWRQPVAQTDPAPEGVEYG